MNIGIMIFGILALAGLGYLIFRLVQGRRYGWLAGLLSIGLFLLIMFFVASPQRSPHQEVLAVNKYPQSYPPAEVQMYPPGELTPESPDIISPEVVESTQSSIYRNGPMWQPAVEDAFQSDTYLSRDAALKALAQQVIQASDNLLEGTPEELAVYRIQPGNSPPRSDEILYKFKDLLNQKLQVFSISTGIKNTEYQPNRAELENRKILIVVLKVPYTRPAGNQYLLDESQVGQLAATIYGKKGQETRRVKFADKQWITDFGTFAGRHQGSRLRIARSREVCLTEGEAQAQAELEACRIVNELISREYTSTIPRQSLNQGRLPFPVNAGELMRSGIIVDNFYQQLESSGGMVWRGALLLDVSPPRLQNLVRLKTGVVQAADRSLRITWLRRIGSLLGMLLLFTVIYFFLNAATRGYYKLSLRIATAVLILAGIIMLIVIRVG